MSSAPGVIQRADLLSYLDKLLEIEKYKDFCPDGLQVEGRATIRKIVCGVTASQAFLDAAVARGADAVLVHHGYFWKGEDYRIVGMKHHRIATLIRNDISLFTYHLPLDGHPELGNNAQLAKIMGWTIERHFGEGDLGCIGRLSAPSTLGTFSQMLATQLGREPLLLGDPSRPIQRIAWCSGGAQSFFDAAITAGADCFVTGEVSEYCTHMARESGVGFLACGHHATERCGVQALGRHLAEKFGIQVDYVEIENPV
ncbi:putative GTP cyclohydrolase 1 type 2 [Paratrimastix pyriformis]|uniref:GTP cyclohydrolase 1 type 2 n=1 Tax=Paratrimastix pyriformis TaxID=342808 RepID=A0ABQ8UP69_9EUKA|nr:putative GTP cyclohydrolase 1 type 2 [Paratrimastix pyriformis]